MIPVEQTHLCRPVKIVIIHRRLVHLDSVYFRVFAIAWLKFNYIIPQRVGTQCLVRTLHVPAIILINRHVEWLDLGQRVATNSIFGFCYILFCLFRHKIHVILCE